MKLLLSEGTVGSDRPDETSDLRRYPVPILWTLLGIFVFASVVRLLAGVVLPVHPDEPWHLLAGHSWLQDGTLRVDNGAYTRTGLFTILVAWFMDLFGETVAVGRFPSSIAGAALTAAVFAWTYRQSGHLAAWFAAGLICFLELAVEMSALVRFYAPHALLLWIGSAALYQLTGTPYSRQRSMIGLGVAVFCLAGAFYLQKTTAVALVPLGLWLACDFAYRSGLWRRLHRRQIMLGLALAVVLGVLAIGLLSSLPVFSELISTYRDVRIWNEANRDDVLFYHRNFMRNAPLLWALSPVAAILAWLYRGRAASFCAAMWFTSILLMSFGGMKADRYIFFAVPYLCALWGLAVASTASLVASNARTEWIPGKPSPPITGGSRTLMMALLISFVLAVASQTSFRSTAYLMNKSLRVVAQAPHQLLIGPGIEPWASNQAQISGMAERASVVLTSRPPATILYLGHFDVGLGHNTVDETLERRELSVDPRSGRPAISTARSLQQFIACFDSGLALIDSPAWRQPGGVDEETAEILMASARLTEFKVSSGSLLAFEWTGGSETGSSECDRIRKMVARSPRIDREQAS